MYAVYVEFDSYKQKLLNSHMHLSYVFYSISFNS